ncbi:MAG: amidinotransferase [Cyclobacteriaceae bacterium]|nr:amidinotransferase [Cyclobacteriaceae bacterium]UYN88276.1 MAG: amidinotransferase [Cyclobacteriaceae bacterium]
MTDQAPHSIMMIRPAAFGFNAQTASSNAFQNPLHDRTEVIQQRALDEFNRMVDLLESHDIAVHVFDDSAELIKPDALFPNNWISFHADGKVILYPMLAENRRLERRTDIIQSLQQKFLVNEIIDLTDEERNNRFLEGTGSLVLDYVNCIAYANRSARTDEALVLQACERLGYKPLIFDAIDKHGKPIYHTNVVMCVGSKFAVVGLDAIQNENDQEILLRSFKETGHKVVAISYEQMAAFAGNMIEVKSRGGESYVLLSERAFHSLLPGQIDAISRFSEMIPIPIDTIETYGGGSVRCMVAGIFNPPR